jgi:hypothetical protein
MLKALDDGTTSAEQLAQFCPNLHKPQNAGKAYVVRTSALDKIDGIAAELRRRVEKHGTPADRVVEAWTALMLLADAQWRVEMVGEPLNAARKRAKLAFERLPKTQNRTWAEAVVRLEPMAKGGYIEGIQLGRPGIYDEQVVADMRALAEWYEELKVQERMGLDGKAGSPKSRDARRPRGEHRPANWFKKGAGSWLRKAAGPNRKTKRVGKYTDDGVILYCVADVEKWNPKIMPDKPKA